MNQKHTHLAVVRWPVLCSCVGSTVSLGLDSLLLPSAGVEVQEESA
jgi:hypothetical protein